MCSHHRPTANDQKWLKQQRFGNWSQCALCEEPEPKTRPVKKTRLKTEESVNREEEDGA